MAKLAPNRPSGLRRYNQFSAVVQKIAKDFQGEEGVSPSHLLNKFKRAAPYIGVPRTVVGLMDLLIAYSRPQDWRPGKVPCVWPRNETLSVKLGVSIRQVQNYVRVAVEQGLLIPRDSANGHRGGIRGADGEIVWGYGFDLSPLAVRSQEFEAIAAKGEADDREIDRLRRMIASLRRRARMLAQAVEEFDLPGIDADEEVELVRMAVALAKGSRNIELLVQCASQMTSRLEAFQMAVDGAMQQVATPMEPLPVAQIVSPKREADYTHSTTTIKLPTANAVTSSHYREKSSELDDIAGLPGRTNVEQDLDRHGIDPAFVANACPELIWDVDLGPRAWGRLVSIAERLAGQHSISPHAWREANRIMGQSGAAAAVIATVYKAMSGEVRQPGAYLRGMSGKALSGELHLSKTFHGLRELSSKAA